ncbi:hypothetical protein GPJ61_26205 [Brevibacillus formosus]|uniref:hypothetical protein n=1 Tax=Brevibacillus formosus TaxID=54913 RepID=UPI001CA4EF41|nr:hypothetical protein [Brevibacillus formosus]MBW5471283.1 hypothetical protein [Brevibacillus formosus]
MLERRNNYYADAVEKLTDPKVMKERLSSPTLHAVLAATHDLKNVHSVKRGKITLELEAKAWEPASKDGDFTRSEELKRKAEGLDGKLLKMADEIWLVFRGKYREIQANGYQSSY